VVKTRAAYPPAGDGEAKVRGFGHLLLVGRDIRLTGRIKACERIVVEGAVEGEVLETSTMEIAPTGRFSGTAAVENCVVAGRFEGELTVSGVLTLKGDGRVEGTIRYGEIEIERGGVIAGSFGPSRATEGTARLRPA